MARRTFVVDGVSLYADAAPPGLHIVATPIGNLGDITIRALKTLAGADMVAAEDTRHTGRLLQHFGIEAHLVRYDEHGAAAQRPRLMADLGEGRSVALVSDAGTPLISDPGYRLVREVREAGIPVHAVPGPAAPMAAASVAGLPTDSLMFAGFLPAKQAARLERIREVMAVPATLVFFEAPHRLAEALADLSEVLGPREAAVARELTKRFETVDRAPLTELAERYAAEPPKGEIVLLVAPPEERGPLAEAEVDALLAAALGKLPASAAAADVARATGLKRSDLYKRALAMKS